MFGIFGDTTELEMDFFTKVSGSTAECPLKLYRAIDGVNPDALPTPTDNTVWQEVLDQQIYSKLANQNEIVTSNLAVDKSTIQWGDKTLTKSSTIKIVDDFAGKVGISTVENPNISKYCVDGNSTVLLTPNSGAFIETDVVGVRYANFSSLNGTLQGITTNASGRIPQQLFSFNLIEEFERKFGSIPKETTAEKIAWLKSNLKTAYCKSYIYGSNPTGSKAYFKAYSVIDSTYYGSSTNTSATPTLTQLQIDNPDLSNYIDSNGFVHFLAYTDKARTTDETLLVLTGHGLTANRDIIENVTRNSGSMTFQCTTNTISTYSIAGQTSGDVINKYKYTINKTAEVGSTSTTLKITNHGLMTGDCIKNANRGYAISKITVIDSNTITCNTAITNQSSGDIINLYPLLGTQTAESTVIPSTIYTDYVSIELTLKAPENLITATNTLNDIVTDFTGKVSGSVVENANISKSTGGSIKTALVLPSDSSFGELGAGSYINISSLNGSNFSLPINNNGAIPQQLFSFNIVSAVEKQLGQPIPAVDKVQWCKDNINKLTCDWTGYGTCPSGNKANFKVWQPTNNAWQLAWGNTSTSGSVALISLGISASNMSTIIDTNGFVHFLAYTDASDGITASTIFTDYIKLTIKLKYIPTYDFYTDVNTRRDAGLTDIVLVKRQIGDMTSDFSGKVAGSVVENPNIRKSIVDGSSVLKSPSDVLFNETSQAGYDAIKTLNGATGLINTSVNGNIPQELFSFNLIEIAQRQLGTSIPGADTASKVQWLKDNLSSIKCDWTGYGSCPSGNKAILCVFSNTGSWTSYISNTSNSPTLLSHSVSGGGVLPLIDSNGFAHYLAYTDASNGTVASTINTDYVKLTLTFKSDTVGVEYFTNNSSEISVTTNAKASAQMVQLDATPLCSALVGGSNSALKALIKNTSNIDFYAIGTGSYVNQLGYGITLKAWNGTAWVTLGSNTNQNIQKTSSVFSNTYLTSDNMIRFLLCSNYKSDGVIGSEVSIDYVLIRLLLTRNPDILLPIQITI